MSREIFIIMLAMGSYFTIGYLVAFLYATTVDEIECEEVPLAVMAWPVTVVAGTCKSLYRLWYFFVEWHKEVGK